MLSLEVFNGTESIMELEQYNAMTPGAATDEESAAFNTILLDP